MRTCSSVQGDPLLGGVTHLHVGWVCTPSLRILYRLSSSDCSPFHYVLQVICFVAARRCHTYWPAQLTPGTAMFKVCWTPLPHSHTLLYRVARTQHTLCRQRSSRACNRVDLRHSAAYHIPIFLPPPNETKHPATRIFRRPAATYRYICTYPGQNTHGGALRRSTVYVRRRRLRV